MIQSYRAAISNLLVLSLCCVAVSVTSFSTSLVAQDVPAAEQATKPALGFSPKEVQDEASLVQKASFFIGFSMMKQAGGKVDKDELVAGMQAAMSDVNKESFINGYTMVKDFKKRGFEFQIEDIVKGLDAAKAGEEMGMTQQEVQVMMGAYQKMVEAKQVAKLKEIATANTAEGEAYIKKVMAETPGAKRLDNGVLYEVLTEGTGEMPKAEDMVKLDYHGTFINGEVFDSSVKPPSGAPPKPIELRTADFVPGFSKALQNMKVGSKWRVVIPGSEAYGARGGAGGAIKPNQALIFEISLLEIVK